MLKKTLQQDTLEALKSGNKTKLEVLRYLSAQIKDAEIAQGKKELTDEEIIKLISKQVKKLEESLVLFKKGQRKDLVEKTQQEIKLLSAYLPSLLSAEELEKAIEKIMAENAHLKQAGPLIGLCVKALAGKADNAQIAAIVQKKLAES